MHMEQITLTHWIRYSRVCMSYQNFLNKGLLVTENLLNKTVLVLKPKFKARYHSLVSRCRISMLQVTMDMFRLSADTTLVKNIDRICFYHGICNTNNMTDVCVHPSISWFVLISLSISV